MNRLSLVLLVLFTQGVWAQDWARAQLEKSPRHREWVTVKHDGRQVETFVVYPESKAKTPVVIIVHEIFGMSDWVQDLADQVAAAGYIAVAPDLLSGMGSSGGRTKDIAQDKVMEAVSHLNPDQVTPISIVSPIMPTCFRHRTASCSWRAFVGAGSQRFRFATNRSDLSAAFVFYGGPPDKDAMTRIKAPVHSALPSFPLGLGILRGL